MSRPKTDPAVLFWAKVDKSGECWAWAAAKDRQGYGMFGFQGRMQGAHRVAYTLTRGDIPVGMMVDHLCHQPACVNPEHLRLATAKQNQENRAGSDAGSTSGLRGVTYHKKAKRWMARACHLGRNYYAGLHDTPEQAAEAARALRNELFSHNELDRKEIPA